MRAREARRIAQRLAGELLDAMIPTGSINVEKVSVYHAGATEDDALKVEKAFRVLGQELIVRSGQFWSPDGRLR